MDCGQNSPSPDRMAFWRGRIEKDLANHLNVAGKARIVLLPSGTDGMLFTALLLALESPGHRLTPVLPSASETGTGVPLAAACRHFDGPAAKSVLHEGWGEPIEVALRRPDGLPREDDEVSDRFAEAARRAPGRPVVFLTHGTKTGLVAPLDVSARFDVVVDACQLRLSSASLHDYLRRGWPVVITGSKFLGGPAFSGAVLLPHGRFETVRDAALAIWRRRCGEATDALPLGPMLRWVAALSSVRQPVGWEQVSTGLQRLQKEMEASLAGLPDVWVVPGPSKAAAAAGGTVPGIVTFAIRDPCDSRRCLAMGEARAVHKSLSARGILVGQPVDLGGFAGLRLAISMRDIARGSIAAGLHHLRAALPQTVCSD